MNCPNCKQPVESKIVDGSEIITCTTCGSLRLEKDGSATVLEGPGQIEQGAEIPGNGVSVAVADIDKPAGTEAGKIVASAPIAPQPVDLLGNEEDAGDSIDLNLHIEVEDE